LLFWFLGPPILSGYTVTSQLFRLLASTDNFEKMELKFLHVILSFQNEFKYKTPRQKIHWKLLLESMKTIQDILTSNSRSCDLRSQLRSTNETKQTRRLKTKNRGPEKPTWQKVNILNEILIYYILNMLWWYDKEYYSILQEKKMYYRRRTDNYLHLEL